MQVLLGDISKAKADVIVNAANTHLEHAGGVALAISEAAGPDLRKECSEWLAASSNKEVGVGNSMITTAGNLNAQKVIHTVGPRESEFMKDPELLTKAFTSALEAAHGLKAQTVAMPLISGGKF